MTERRYNGRLFSADDLAVVAAVLADRSAYPTRAAIAREVSSRLPWLLPDGRPKQMACSLALRAMERDGLLTLPPPRTPARRPGPVTLTAASDRQPRITGSRRDLGPILLRTIADKAESALWRELVAAQGCAARLRAAFTSARWHYLGFRAHGGAQLRYLAWDAQGRLLGAMDFSASAWKIAARDRLIGWNTEQRMARLHLVVNQSTFLILPWIRVKNLSSSLLGQAVRRLPSDWAARYVFAPVLAGRRQPDRAPARGPRLSGAAAPDSPALCRPPASRWAGRRSRRPGRPALPQAQLLRRARAPRPRAPAAAGQLRPHR